MACNIRHLILGGVFSDVCVDAIARTAYQKGFFVSVATDATLPLERDADEACSFMQRFYGARLKRVDELCAVANRDAR